MDEFVSAVKDAVAPPSMHRRVPSTSYEAISSEKLGQPAWMAIPDDDDAEVEKARSWSGTAWWMIISGCVLAVLMHGEAPWWLIAIVAAEAYTSLRRVIGSLGKGAIVGAKSKAARTRRLRHFTSVRLAVGAPLDEIVARFLAFDSLETVRSIELGTNSSGEQRSRGHSLAMLVTFVGTEERNAFLRSPERTAFKAFLEPFVAEWFVFDFESGAVN